MSKTEGKKRRKRRGKHSSTATPSTQSEPPLDSQDSLSDVEIVYAPDSVDLDAVDPSFSEFKNVFARFAFSVDSADASADVVVPDKAEDANLDSDDERVDVEGENNIEEEDLKISRKKLRKEKRLSVAELKQIVKKPEAVEWVDVCAADPKLLIELKAYRNTVPVPIHWQQKRKYLQGKRGIEKPPFELPDFIKKTGISEMRSAVREKEDQQRLKSKTRERHQPKMGKLDIDYQKLHDAFFRWQTKPKLTIHGDLYYEGKEFETKLKLKKPGQLSEELKIALNIPLLAPPPWLINMQRYGPPPSYPNLKIPGLNAPIPEGAQWGYHPGGWGKPPVDEYNRPLYGDVFGTVVPEIPTEHVAPIERELWGQLESDEEEEEVEEEEEEEEEEEAATEEPIESGLVTPSGMASVPSGLETPEFIELRKDSRKMADDEPKQLYQVLPERATSTSGQFMGSQHIYDLTAAAKSSSKRKAQGVDVSFNPEDLEQGLDEEALRQRYDQQVSTSSESKGEDFSDMVAEHANKQAQQAKKRRKEESKSSSSSKKREFKF